MRYDDRMSDMDRIMWVIEKNPLLRSPILAVSILDHLPQQDRIWQRIDRASRVIPRLRQRVVWNPYSIAPPRWEFDPNFDLDCHVRFHSLDGKGRLGDLLHMTEQIGMHGFDRDRPLWEFVVVDGLERGQGALITKLHHAMTDGMGAVNLMLELLDLERDAPAPDLPPEPRVVVLNQVQRFANALRHELTRQREMISMGIEAIDHLREEPKAAVRDTTDLIRSAQRMAASGVKPLSPVMQQRSLSVSHHALEMPLAKLKNTVRREHVKVNDVLLAATAQGMFAYHEALGAPVNKLRMGLPINRRTGANANRSGNEFIPTRFEVPISIRDPREHMRAMHELVALQRAEPVLSLLEPLAGVVSRLPRFVVTNIFSAALSGQDFNVSNVPGVDFPLYFEGAQLLGQYPIGPLSGAAVNVTLLSYNSTAFIGVNIDPAAVTEPERLVACLREGFKRTCSTR